MVPVRNFLVPKSTTKRLTVRVLVPAGQHMSYPVDVLTR